MDSYMADRKLLHEEAERLRIAHAILFEEYKMSRFGKSDASVLGAGFTVQGLPPHHKLNFHDMNEADLLETHREYLDVYKTALTAVIEDESEWDKKDNYVNRNDGRTFQDIRDLIEKTRTRVSHQIEVQKLTNVGTILHPPEDPFNFDPVEEVYRNIRDLCVLEDLNIYLEELGRHTSLLMDKHNVIEGIEGKLDRLKQSQDIK